MVDKTYCASSYLMYRTVADKEKCFSEKLPINRFVLDFPRTPVYTADDLRISLENQIKEWTADGKAALALSGGIDSAILAKFMPGGGTVYTFQCIVPGVEITNEAPQAAKYAELCNLNQVVVPIYWEDFEEYTPLLMKHKGAPIHSIEVQIYKAALQAKADGFERIIFGESSDLNYGGLSGLMSKDWKFGEFADRYMYVKPYYVLKNYNMDLSPIQKYEEYGYVKAHEFCRNFFIEEAMGSYTNACETAGIDLCAPYVHTKLAVPLNFARIRAGENKYIVREAFHSLYGNLKAPEKLPMPRAVNEWFQGWSGPTRQEFWPHCTDGMSGDQKWYVWCLERFLDMLDTI